MNLAGLAIAVMAALTATSALAAPNWLVTIDTADGAHAIGNPAADVKLTQFVSYNCQRCGEFQVEAGNALDLYVATGKVQLDVRLLVRDAVDMTASVLANCGPASKFYGNHKAIMRAQPRWLPRAASASAGQKARWSNGPAASRRRAVASDLQFYDLMATRGYGRVEVERCLADPVLAQRIETQAAAHAARSPAAGAPGFAMDDEPLETADWKALRRQIDARITD